MNYRCLINAQIDTLVVKFHIYGSIHRLAVKMRAFSDSTAFLLAAITRWYGVDGLRDNCDIIIVTYLTYLTKFGRLLSVKKLNLL